jgi:Replicase family
LQPSLIAGADTARTAAPETARFFRQFARHLPHRWWRASPAKDAADRTVRRRNLGRYAFFRPNHSGAWQAIVIDIDRPDALASLTAPDLPRPHWIIETDKGAQAGWLIENVSTRRGASEIARAYAEDVALRLRHTLGGDPAVHPLTASRVRNPLYGPLLHNGRLRTFATAPYSLGELRWTLYAAGRWVKRLPGDGPVPDGEYPGRNNEINTRAWLTVRRELEAGKRSAWTYPQVLDLVRTIGMDVAGKWPAGPLPQRQLEHIAANITTYQHRPGSRRRGYAGATAGEQARRGAKGGSVQSLAQQRQTRELIAAGTAVRSANKALRDEQIRIMRWDEGRTNGEIAAALGVSIDTVKRAVRGGCISQAPRVTAVSPGPADTPADQPASTEQAGRLARLSSASGPGVRRDRPAEAGQKGEQQPEQPAACGGSEGGGSTHSEGAGALAGKGLDEGAEPGCGSHVCLCTAVCLSGGGPLACRAGPVP